MLIKPFPHGKGNGREPTHYLVRQDYHGRKEHPPVVLRGDPDMTRRLIDSIDREWKFTAGVCSWGTGDAVTPEQEAHVMDDFEAVAFAGMQPDQYSILWVRHSHAGHHEFQPGRRSTLSRPAGKKTSLRSAIWKTPGTAGRAPTIRSGRGSAPRRRPTSTRRG